MFNIAILYFLGFITSIFLCFLVIYRASKKTLNNFFIILCILSSYFCFIDYELSKSSNYQEALLWIKMLFLWPFFLPTVLLFVLNFTNYQIKKKYYLIFILLLYIPAFVFSVIELLSFKLTGKPVHVSMGWTYSNPEISWILILSISWSIIIAFISIIVCIKYYFKVKDINRKKQVLFLTIGLLIPIINFILTDGIFQVINIKIPDTSTIGMIITNCLIAYAIIKYELFRITPEIAAKSIIGATSDSIILVDLNYNIKIINRATIKMLRYRKNELLNKKFSIIFKNKNIYKNIMDDMTLKLSNKGYIGYIETKYKTKNNKKISVSLSISVLKDKKSKIQGYIFLARNIRMRKKIERRMKFLNNSLIESAYQIGISKFTTGILHDIRNILTGLNLNVDNLYEYFNSSKLYDLSEIHDFFVNYENEIMKISDNSIKGSIPDKFFKIENNILLKNKEIKYDIEEMARNISIINDIIDTQQEFAKNESTNKKVNINSLIDEILRIQKKILLENNIIIEKKFSNIPEISISKTRLMQVFINIIKNAYESVKSVNEDNKENKKIISIKTECDEKKIYIKISDTGRGINNNDLLKIFSFGFSTKTNGHGFGLFTSSNFLKEIGGDITARSKGIGKGADFIISLPIK